MFLILDLIADTDADRSEFFVEPGTTIPLIFALHFSNMDLVYWFQSLEALNTKLCNPISSVTLGSNKDILLFWLLSLNNS